jgi:hypothetical protein
MEKALYMSSYKLLPFFKNADDFVKGSMTNICQKVIVCIFLQYPIFFVHTSQDSGFFTRKNGGVPPR